MEITVEHQNQALVVAANGRVDSSNAAVFQQELTAATDDSNQSVILDLEGLSYLSSAGLRVILLIAKSQRTKDAGFAVCSPSDPIREIFEISGFTQIIPVHATKDEAVAALKK
jgi:anti-anti-sigma factor